MTENFEDGMGVTWDAGERMLYGVVTKVQGRSATIVPVYPLNEHDRCYDEGGAVYARDRDNVMLKSCPPPFTFLCLSAERGRCYAFADPASETDVPLDDMALLGISVVDGGEKVAISDLAAIADHPWRDEPEEQKRPAKQMTAMDRIRMAAGTQPEHESGPDHGIEY